MPNALHILETALLILVAFLVGATIGTLARRLTLPRAKPVAQPAAADAPAPAGPQLVVAPTIAPVAGARSRTPAERLAAAAGRDVDPVPALQPSRTAGEATAGIVVPPPAVVLDGPPPAEPAVPAAPEIVELPPPVPAGEVVAASPPAPAPVAPDVAPEPVAGPVLASEVPPIDEQAQVVERVVADVAPEPQVDPVLPPEPETFPEHPSAAETPAAPRLPLAEIDEDAAMRAIESGDWRPRRAAPSRPVQHPEHVGPHEVDAAMATARSAVAAATAAAAAALAEAEELARERRAAAAVLDFEPSREVEPEGFLAANSSPQEHVERSGLNFEIKPRAGFGQPEGLAAPRQGGADNLKQIKGITPQLESTLNGLGIFHFDQIAGWDHKAAVWMDHHLTLKGRVAKEKWIEQARDLSQGKGRLARPVRR